MTVERNARPSHATASLATRVASLYADWGQYAERLRDGVKDLTADELALRAGPEHAPIWALAAHVAGTRVYWLCGVLGEPGAEATPWPTPLTDPGWEDDLAHPRTGGELAFALDSSWAVVRDSLERWSVGDLGRTAVRIRDDGVRQVHSRASVLNRMFSHDAFHAGEISQQLGVNHLPPIDLWVRRAVGGRDDSDRAVPGVDRSYPRSLPRPK